MSFLCKCPSHRIIRTSLAVTMSSLMLLLTGCTSGQPADSIAGNAAGQADVSAKSEAADMTDSAAGQSTAGQADISAESKAPDMADSTADQSSSAQDHEDISGPKSVVAVSKSNADLWLLAGGELSGTTEDAMELDGISGNTAVVGTLSKPNSEAILALEPDLVLLAVDIPAQKELKAELDEMGIRTIAIEIDSFEDYKACMKELTELTGRDDLYEQNAVQVGERIEAIKADVQNGSSKDFDSAAGTSVRCQKDKSGFHAVLFRGKASRVHTDYTVFFQITACRKRRQITVLRFNQDSCFRASMQKDHAGIPAFQDRPVNGDREDILIRCHTVSTR